MEGSQTSQSTSQYRVCDAVQRLTHEIISINVKSFQKAFLFCFHFKNKYWALTIFEKNKDKLLNSDTQYTHQEVSGRGHGDFVMEEFITVVTVGVTARNCL